MAKTKEEITEEIAEQRRQYLRELIHGPNRMVGRQSLADIVADRKKERYLQRLEKAVAALQSSPITLPDTRTPTDLITLAVAAKMFSVSRPTLQRQIDNGAIKSYRPDRAKANSPHKVSAKEIAALYPKR